MHSPSEGQATRTGFEHYVKQRYIFTTCQAFCVFSLFTVHFCSAEKHVLWRITAHRIQVEFVRCSMAFYIARGRTCGRIDTTQISRNCGRREGKALQLSLDLLDGRLHLGFATGTGHPVQAAHRLRHVVRYQTKRE